MMKKRPKEVPKREIIVFRRPDTLVELHIHQHAGSPSPLDVDLALYDEEFQELKSKINKVKME
jgi:hypothetical protein